MFEWLMWEFPNDSFSFLHQCVREELSRDLMSVNGGVLTHLLERYIQVDRSSFLRKTTRLFFHSGVLER